MLMCFAVSHALKQPLQDVLNWPIREVRDWMYYFEIVREEQDKG